VAAADPFPKRAAEDKRDGAQGRSIAWPGEIANVIAPVVEPIGFKFAISRFAPDSGDGVRREVAG